VQPLEKNRSQKNKQGKSIIISKQGKIMKMKRIATMIVTDMKSTTISKLRITTICAAARFLPQGHFFVFFGL